MYTFQTKNHSSEELKCFLVHAIVFVKNLKSIATVILMHELVRKSLKTPMDTRVKETTA